MNVDHTRNAIQAKINSLVSDDNLATMIEEESSIKAIFTEYLPIETLPDGMKKLTSILTTVEISQAKSELVLDPATGTINPLSPTEFVA